jgi:hypothetical protein
MFAAPLAPHELIGALRVVAYVRGSRDGADLGARCDELADRIRAIYDWPVEFYFFDQQRDGVTPAEEIVWLLEAGDWRCWLSKTSRAYVESGMNFTSSLSDVSTLAGE